MIYPTMNVEVWKKQGSDIYAQPKFAKMIVERVCPVKLNFQSANTTVRTDSASSKGHIQESIAQVTLLTIVQTKIEIGDKLVVLGHPLRVAERHPRYTVAGELDHYQLICLAWT